MLRLNLFGAVAVTRDGHSIAGLSASPRRLALLALVAAEGDRGVSRDALLGMLWPESDEGAARHSLDQAVHATRRHLGPDDVLVGTRVLRLSRDHISADLWEFEAALRDRHLERAVALHAAPFANGLSVRDASELDRVLSQRRTQCAVERAGALESLARTAMARGDRAAAVEWWRRLAAAEPLRAGAVRELVAALAAAAEPAQALRAALVHEALVRQENLPLDPEIARWIQRLRAQRADEAPVRPAGATPEPAFVVADAPPERRRAERVSRAIGRAYRVDALLEEGSTLGVWSAARAADAQSSVEVHVVQPALAAGVRPTHFVAAMRAAAGVHDARVLPTLDAGVDGDVCFTITACRVRPPLRDRLRREGPLPLPTAVAIARDVAQALASAHQRGVLHGDLRPRHVGLGGDGAVVAGFGLVDAITGASDDDGRSTVVSLGVPAYQSPERLGRSAPLSARDDVYALGCLLYEMLAGEPPFGRTPTAAAVRQKLSASPPSLCAIRESVPEGLERIVLNCLARAPGDRYADGGEVLQAWGSANSL